jgi:polyphosphate kinase
MRSAGVKIIESIPGLKVHAKIALVKRKTQRGAQLFGLLSTGNFNENTARFYTDHILITANKSILNEVELLFKILKKTKGKKYRDYKNDFTHLLVGQFNLQERFIALIDREITFAKLGLPALINIKFNNLEDKVLIAKLYEASVAGVRINLIVRGICCLIPGLGGMSENIKVTRIVDRFLEHGRLFIFGNNGDPEVFLGSADWMNRNIYRRIEVCFPVYDNILRAELLEILNIQLRDNVKADSIGADYSYVPVEINEKPVAIQSQIEIMNFLRDQNRKLAKGR